MVHCKNFTRLRNPSHSRQCLLMRKNPVHHTIATQRFPLRTPPLTTLKTEYTPEYQILPDAYLGRTATPDHKNLDIRIPDRLV